RVHGIADLVLKRGVTVRGRVLTAAGLGVAGAALLRAGEGDLYASEACARTLAMLATSKDDGSYVVEGLPPGAFRRAARASGHPPALRSGMAAAGETVDGFDVVVSEGASLSGRVAGLPPQRHDRILISARLPASGHRISAAVASDARFEMTGLA